MIGDPTVDYIGATSEGEAVGITSERFLAGRKTVTMCQNSGLGNMVNPLTSLNYPFRVPTLLIVTWRGQPEVRDEPQHEQMGRIMQRLLETMEIPYLPFPAGETEIAQTLAEAEASMQERKRPFALVMQRGSVAPQALSGRLEPESLKTDLRQNLSAKESEQLTRTAAIEVLLDALAGDEAIIATTGKTRPRTLHNLGSRQPPLCRRRDGDRISDWFRCSTRAPEATSGRDRRRWRCLNEARRARHDWLLSTIEFSSHHPR